LVRVGDRWVSLQPAKLGLWLSQHPRDMIPWLRFALEVQLADFFGPALAAFVSWRKSSEGGAASPAPISPRSQNI